MGRRTEKELIETMLTAYPSNLPSIRRYNTSRSHNQQRVATRDLRCVEGSDITWRGALLFDAPFARGTQANEFANPLIRV